MKKGLMILMILLFLISGIYAQCNETQINVNTASAEELTEIKHIGDIRANEIIELRTEKLFESVDDLIRVSGIVAGGSRLSDIINQGLACVDEETQEEVEKETLEEPEEREEENNEISEVIEDFKEESNIKEPITFDTISLKPKNPALHDNRF